MLLAPLSLALASPSFWTTLAVILPPSMPFSLCAIL